jgi:symplekin
MAREGEVLRYWIQASIYCTLPGVFTSNTSEDAVASRGVISASASLRPALKHIARKIQDADDRGAAKLYSPVMKMVSSVLNKLFEREDCGDALRSACIKFLEIVAVCCSSKGEDVTDKRRHQKGHQAASQDFSLEDLPEGHPVITREALESIAEYAFTTLRGLVLMGGTCRTH